MEHCNISINNNYYYYYDKIMIKTDCLFLSSLESDPDNSQYYIYYVLERLSKKNEYQH